MKKNYLHPEHRATMRDLIQGFIQHCEIAPTLVGRIERFAYHKGRKYGFPTFTVFGPALPAFETQFLGLVGINDGETKTASETLLELIERLSVQPHVAAGHVLRVLPVSDPIGLELGTYLPDEEVELAITANLNAFRREAADGMIELRLTDARELQVIAEGPATLLGAARTSQDVLRRLRSEEQGDTISVTRGEVERNGTWRLRLEIPRSWPPSLAVHWGSQFLVVFLRSHTAALALREQSAASPAGV